MGRASESSEMELMQKKSSPNGRVTPASSEKAPQDERPSSVEGGAAVAGGEAPSWNSCFRCVFQCGSPQRASPRLDFQVGGGPRWEGAQGSWDSIKLIS